MSKLQLEKFLLLQVETSAFGPGISVWSTYVSGRGAW